MADELADKVVIVTGGGDGEGLTAAEGLLRHGARVSIWDDDVARLESARGELQAQGLQPDVCLVDVAASDEVQSAYERVRAALGAVDVLLNNATLKNAYMMGPENPYPYRPVPFWELNLDRFRRAIEVNVMGTYLCSRVVAPDMIARRRGVIINTSTNTKRSPDHIPYGPSKALVEAFSLAAAEQLRPYGVRVNVVDAGGRVNQRGENDPANQPYDCFVPLLVYLCGDRSRDVTGQTMSAAAFNRERVRA
jgi:NAD(P)-dependent dehydrogenase (short-subunit alcohol dehydrogenase family)